MSIISEVLKKELCCIDEEGLNLFERYAELLIKKNKEMNLTSITEPSQIASRHFLDSLSILKAYNIEKGSLIDIGSGAGFPGIPISIMCPKAHVTLLDSTGKKVEFLKETVKKLGLSNVSCVNGRAEELAHNKDFREVFDFAVSRAVSRLGILYELCIPYIKPEGYFFAIKSSGSGGEIEEAAGAALILGCDNASYTDYELPGAFYTRVIKVRKTKKTPEIYPRQFSKMKKEILS